MSEPKIVQRKADHIEVAASGRADFAKRSTLLEHVHLIHQSLPELEADAVDLTTTLCGHTLSAPIVISGMTGGTEEAAGINRDLATVAQEMGVGFGVGSQRAMAEHPELSATFEIRDVAPDVFLIGNVGVVQAKAYGPKRVAELAEAIGANAMAIHLNPAQEMIQADGDRDFRGGIETLATLAQELPIPVIAKETGCGLSPEAAAKIAGAGIKTVDVSGAGGTSWVAVEAERAQPGSGEQALGRELWDWGVPTAVATHGCARAGLDVVATGGMRSGHDIARAIALGATAGGLAAPALRAQRSGGQDGVRTFLRQLIRSVRTVSLLCGVAKVHDLAKVPRHIGPSLAGWLDDLGLR